MTVSELIGILSQYDPQATVIVDASEEILATVETVEENTGFGICCPVLVIGESIL